jgi:hypothetical protein
MHCTCLPLQSTTTQLFSDTTLSSHYLHHSLRRENRFQTSHNCLQPIFVVIFTQSQVLVVSLILLLYFSLTFLSLTLGNAHRLYARHFEGFLELEVADLGWARNYRVFSIDHDLVSFADVSLDRWPVVVITNPKDASVLLPDREPIHRIQTSSHIR